MTSVGDSYREPCLAAVVEVTNRCNLRCPHCASDSGTARADELSLDEMTRVVDDLASLGCRELTVLGGEFLLRPDWFDIAHHVRARGLELQLVTNGLLVTETVRRQFRTLGPQTVGVSLDGATPESYRAARGVDGFDRCRRLLDDLVSDGLREVHAITTFNAKNLTDFDRFAELFADTPIVWQIQMAHRGGERFSDDLLMTRDQYAWLADRVTRWYETGRDRLRLLVMDDFGYFPMTPALRFLHTRWIGCPAGRFLVGVRANGDVLPCLSLGSRFVGGNLRRRPLVGLWRDPVTFAAFRNKSCTLTGKCAGCAFAAKCRAGCSAMALSQTGTLTETTFCVRQLEQERIVRTLFG